MKAYERIIERNKERILRATLELFQTYGVKRATISDIAHKAGVSLATVYNHFGNKENLTRDTIKYFLTTTVANISQIIKDNLSFLEKMERIILYKSDMFGQYQGAFIQTIISEDQEIRHIIDSVYLTEIRQLMIDFYEEGKRLGYVNPELSTENILRYLSIVRSGMAAESVLSENSEHNRKIMQELTRLFLYGIMGKPRFSGYNTGEDQRDG